MPEMIPGVIASGDHSTQQFYVVQMSGSTTIDFEIVIQTGAQTSTTVPIGILQDDPNTSGHGASVIAFGMARAQYGGAVNQGNRLGSDSDGRLIARVESSTADVGLWTLATAVQNGTSGGNYDVFVTGPNSSRSTST